MGFIEMITLRRNQFGFEFNCPACAGAIHIFHTTVPLPTGDVWTWDGDIDAPTFSPSLRVIYKSARENVVSGVCHLFVRAGVLSFCGDSTHGLAGKELPVRVEP